MIYFFLMGLNVDILVMVILIIVSIVFFVIMLRSKFFKEGDIFGWVVLVILGIMVVVNKVRLVKFIILLFDGVVL